MVVTPEDLNILLTDECSKLWGFYSKYGMEPNIKKQYDENFYEEVIVFEAKIPTHSKFWILWKEEKQQLLLQKKMVIKRGEFFYLQSRVIPSEFRHPLEELNNVINVVEYPKLDERIEKLLKPHQIETARFNLNVLNEKKVIINTSDPGTGKTYETGAIIRQKNVIPIAVVPKVITRGWIKAFSHFAISRYYLTTWDLFKRGKFIKYERSKRSKKMTKKTLKLPFVDVKVNEDPEGPKYLYKFNFTNEMCLIWDEAHRLKNTNTQVFSMFKQLMKNKPNYMIFLSATIAESPAKAIPLLMAIGMIQDESQIEEVMDSFHTYNSSYGYQFEGDKEDILRLHRLISAYGKRMKMADVGGLPPQTIIPEVYESDNIEVIEKLYSIYNRLPILLKLPEEQRSEELTKINKEIREMAKLTVSIKEIMEYSQFIYQKLAEAENMGWRLAIRTRLLQLIELNKIPIILQLVKDAYEQGYSIPIFFNYTMNVKILASLLGTTCVFTGKNKELGFGDREENRLKFQDNRERIIIGSFLAMRESVDLHDTVGNFPRMVFIPYNDSAQNFKQAIGRTHRDGKKSPDTIYVVHIADTIEEKVKENLERKLFNLSLLNDGELDPLGEYIQIYGNQEVEI